MIVGTVYPPVLLDDGEFYVELHSAYAPAEAPGFLQRRCYVGVTTPGGYECVGSFSREPSGKWTARIDAHDGDADARCVGTAPDRIAAIAALWSSRHEAYCRHKVCELAD